MRIGILGTGVVGQTLGRKLVEKGHEVRMGARRAGNERAAEWVRAAGSGASQGTFEEAAAFGEVLFNCTAGSASLDALRQAGAEKLRGKILIDVSNPLDFSSGFPPSLTVCNTDSVGEQIQRAFPEARVVKTLNTVTAALMVDPSLVPGEHVLFLNGNGAEAKRQVTAWLGEWFGWPASRIVDVGDITTARGTEMYLALWVRLYAALGSPMFNLALMRAPA
jgi:predicted dinucleotide-binding enzyme